MTQSSFSCPLWIVFFCVTSHFIKHQWKKMSALHTNNQLDSGIHLTRKTLPACICQIYIFVCALSLQLYRCGLRLEEISDQLGSATPTNRVPNHEGRRNSYSELLNRLSNIPVLCLCRVSLLSWSNFVSGSVVFTYMYKPIVDITFWGSIITCLQARGFQIPGTTIFWFLAQKSWETIGNNFLVWWKFMGTHFYFF